MMVIEYFVHLFFFLNQCHVAQVGLHVTKDDLDILFKNSYYNFLFLCLCVCVCVLQVPPLRPEDNLILQEFSSSAMRV